MTILEEVLLGHSLRSGLLLIGGLAALLYGARYCHRAPSAAKTLVKTIPMSAFALAGWHAGAAPLVVAALALSAFGDFALSRDGDRAFLAGLVGFALAHVAYVFHFFALADPVSPLVSMPLAAGLILFLAASTEVWLSPYTAALRWPVRGYVVIITAMGLAALGLVDRPLAQAGALAFIASDTILAVQLFRMKPDARLQVHASVMLWALYALGQFLILLGAGWVH